MPISREAMLRDRSQATKQTRMSFHRARAPDHPLRLPRDQSAADPDIAGGRLAAIRKPQAPNSRCQENTASKRDRARKRFGLIQLLTQRPPAAVSLLVP